MNDNVMTMFGDIMVTYCEQRELDDFSVDVYMVEGKRVAIHIGKLLALLIDDEDTIVAETTMKWNSNMVNHFGVEYEIRRQLIDARIHMDTELMAQIEILKDAALRNYENGGDGAFECWEDRDYAQHVWEDPDTSIQRFMKDMISYKEHGDEIRATAF